MVIINGMSNDRVLYKLVGSVEEVWLILIWGVGWRKRIVNKVMWCFYLY